MDLDQIMLLRHRFFYLNNSLNRSQHLRTQLIRYLKIILLNSAKFDAFDYMKFIVKLLLFEYIHYCQLYTVK